MVWTGSTVSAKVRARTAPRNVGCGMHVISRLSSELMYSSQGECTKLVPSRFERYPVLVMPKLKLLICWVIEDRIYQVPN